MDDCPKRIVIFAPNWVGDAVMFTPALRAIRRRFADAHMALLARPAPAATLTPNPWTNEIIAIGSGVLEPVRTLRRGRFDLAVLGPNSFRSALVARLGGAGRRIGYNRDGRGWLLTDRIPPQRDAIGGFAVVPAIDYYLAIAEHLGCDAGEKRMELAVADADATSAEELLNESGADRTKPIVLLNPGASYGTSKIYPSARFAAVADGLIEGCGAQIVINAGPDEKPIAEAVEGAMKHQPLLNLARVVNSLGLLKAMVRISNLMITNDTGPRHFAAALGVPVVTVFGSTDPAWTDIYYDRERIVRVNVPCGPCQKKECPLPTGPNRHQCMLEIPPESILGKAEELLNQERCAEQR
ncbi:MAG: lipopolysaccharide heptosyltransferase II [Planctomycetota bacterium]|nr:lipopolysaccharide heptosyltransferase II [Planctomycetota bacterium]